MEYFLPNKGGPRLPGQRAQKHWEGGGWPRGGVFRMLSLGTAGRRPGAGGYPKGLGAPCPRKKEVNRGAQGLGGRLSFELGIKNEETKAASTLLLS